MARACFPLCRHHLPFPASLTSRVSHVSRWCTLVSIACDCIMHLSGPFNLVSLPIFPSFVHVEPIQVSPAFSLSFLKCLHSTTPFAKPLSLSLCARLHHCTTDVIADGRWCGVKVVPCSVRSASKVFLIILPPGAGTPDRLPGLVWPVQDPRFLVTRSHFVRVTFPVSLLHFMCTRHCGLDLHHFFLSLVNDVSLCVFSQDATLVVTLAILSRFS